MLGLIFERDPRAKYLQFIVTVAAIAGTGYLSVIESDELHKLLPLPVSLETVNLGVLYFFVGIFSAMGVVGSWEDEAVSGSP